jgi:5-deoxy-glucuronate isomerase
LCSTPEEEFAAALRVKMNTHEAEIDKMVFRRTNAHLGRKICVSPGNSTMKHLEYARIILNASAPEVKFSNGPRETGLICLNGQGAVFVNGETISLGRFDALYIPRDSNVEVRTGSSVDVAEFSAEVEKQYPLQVVRSAEVAKDPGLKFTVGKEGNTRHIDMLLAKNVQAGRLLVGVTHSDPGNWTSWPPHEHAKMLEEIYVYFDMPAPAYGLQLVYQNTEDPELVTVVRDGDAVMIPGGYHPNVAVPGHPIAFLWAMAAHREGQDRQYGVVNLQPGFDQAASGLEAGRTK